MEEFFETGMLLDFYGELLTEKQQKVLKMHVNDDMSITEISEELGISRQGVQDFITKGKKQLAAFEEKLGMLKKFNTLREKLEKICVVTDDKDIEAKLEEVISEL